MQRDDRGDCHARGGHKLALDAGKAQPQRRPDAVGLCVERGEARQRAQHRPDPKEIAQRERAGEERDLRKHMHCHALLTRLRTLLNQSRSACSQSLDRGCGAAVASETAETRSASCPGRREAASRDPGATGCDPWVPACAGTREFACANIGVGLLSSRTIWIVLSSSLIALMSAAQPICRSTARDDHTPSATYFPGR